MRNREKQMPPPHHTRFWFLRNFGAGKKIPAAAPVISHATIVS